MEMLVCCNSDILAIPVLQQLTKKRCLAGICIPENSKDYLIPIFKHLKLGVDVFSLRKYDWEDKPEQIIRNRTIDSVWILTFLWIFFKSIIENHPRKFINLHFGLLTKYLGNAPILRQIKNKEAHDGITVHYINEKVDQGPVILQKKLSIFPRETYGIHCQRLRQFCTSIINLITEKIAERDFCSLIL